MVGAVGEMASMKQRNLWKMGEDGLCCSSSAIQIRLGPSSRLEERSEIPIVLVVSFVLLATPKLGETANVYRIEMLNSNSIRGIISDFSWGGGGGEQRQLGE